MVKQESRSKQNMFVKQKLKSPSTKTEQASQSQYNKLLMQAQQVCALELWGQMTALAGDCTGREWDLWRARASQGVSVGATVEAQ